MKEKYLPIGTVVTLKNATKKIMITGYFPMGDDKQVFDYNACTYPEGIVVTDKTLVFNHEQIQEINHMGLETEESKDFNEQLKQMLSGLETLKDMNLPNEAASANQQTNIQNISEQPSQNTQSQINDISDIMNTQSTSSQNNNQ